MAVSQKLNINIWNGVIGLAACIFARLGWEYHRSRVSGSLSDDSCRRNAVNNNFKIKR